MRLLWYKVEAPAALFLALNHNVSTGASGRRGVLFPGSTILMIITCRPLCQVKEVIIAYYILMTEGKATRAVSMGSCLL